MIDTAGFVGALANGADLGVQCCGVERRRAERAEAAGVGDGRDQRRRSRRAHAAAPDRVRDAQQIAIARVDHNASYWRDPPSVNFVSVLELANLTPERVRTKFVLP